MDDDYAFLEAAVDAKLPPPPEEKPRDSSRSKDGGREDRERSSKEKRHRSRSRDRKRSSREGDRPSSRDRGRDRVSSRERHASRELPPHRRERSPPRRRERTPPEVRLAREKERELKELERATRTVMAYNVNVKADERDIWEFFSKAGEVTDIRIITDRHTRRSKGIAYVEFSKQECVFAALALTGQAFMGQAVMVKSAEAEKNVAWEAAQAAKANQSDAAALLQAAGLAVPPPAAPPPPGGGGGVTLVPVGPPLLLRVSGFPAGLGEVELRQVFEPFGSVLDVSMVKDAAGGDAACDILFASAAEGQVAAAHWSTNQILGCQMSVLQVPVPMPAEAVPGAAADAAAAVGGGGGGAYDVGELDDEEGGLRLNSQARAALMSRLAGGGAAPAPAAGGGGAPGLVVAAGAPSVDPSVMFAQGVLGPPSPIPTQCIILKNVWRGEQTAEPGWEAEVAEDMREEAGKCGQLLHMHIDLASQGFVYAKFAGVEGAQAAHKLLNGRFYQGNQIMVEFQFAQPYNAHFGLA
ncbi:MAG: splicing factor, CC1-like protein [Monoraphidium minutum]|nr:MAG: splicing factor, CC1-like protein [Monoraphidium minutum]